MRYLFLALVLIPALAFAQIPSLTDNSLLRYREGNTIFDRPISDLRDQVLPSGTTKYTLRHDGSTWVASSLLQNDGSQIGINTAPSSSYKLFLKQATTTDGIAIQRSSSGNLLLYHSSAGIIQTDVWNMEIRSAGQLSIYGPGGASQTNQVFLSAQSNITAALGNAGLLRFGGTYAPTAAGGDFSFLKFLPAVNQGGSSDQTVYMMDMNPTLTSVKGDIIGFNYRPSAYTFISQPNGNAVKSHLYGNLGIGANTTSPGAKLHIVGNGSTSGTYSQLVYNAADSIIVALRDDRKVGINTNSPAEALDVIGQGRVDALDLRNWTGGNNTNDGQLQYHNGSGGTYSAYLTYGAGERRFPVMPYTVQLQAVDYDVSWTTGRTKAFWTVPERFTGWKVSKVYLMVSSIGSTTGNTIVVEKNGSTIGTQTISSSDHTLTLDTSITTGDIFTFNITSTGATASKGLLVEVELRHN